MIHVQNSFIRKYPIVLDISEKSPSLIIFGPPVTVLDNKPKLSETLIAFVHHPVTFKTLIHLLCFAKLLAHILLFGCEGMGESEWNASAVSVVDGKLRMGFFTIHRPTYSL